MERSIYTHSLAHSGEVVARAKCEGGALARVERLGWSERGLFGVTVRVCQFKEGMFEDNGKEVVMKISVGTDVPK